MTEKESIFARIREALRVPATSPGMHEAGERLDRVPPHRAGLDGTSSREEGKFARYLPSVGASLEEMTSAFAAASKELRTDFRFLQSEAEAHDHLTGLRDAEGWKRVGAHRGTLAGPFAERLGLPVAWTGGGYDKQELETCDAGITECDVLVAQTGTVVLTTATAGGRALSVLPPHHVVLANRTQLVSDLPAAFEALQDRYGSGYPSMISFVTGPSRTGDIERILVLGAHGPKRLTVVCW